MALRRADVDLTVGTVRVHRSMPKLTGGHLVPGPPESRASVRTVTLPRVLIEELRRHLGEYVGPAGTDHIFTGPKGATPKRGNWRVSVKWPAQVAAAGLPAGFHVHDPSAHGQPSGGRERSLHARANDRMGHSTMAAALHYQHATDERARQIADRLSAVVESRMSSTE